MKYYEVEQKYRISGPAPFKKRLKKLGAKKISSGREVNRLYDRDGFLWKQGCILRLRRTFAASAGAGRSHAKLTFKGPRRGGKYKRRLEVESPTDYGSMSRILEMLGFKVAAVYSKTREEYRLGSVLITVDHLPGAGWFLEIEGNAAAIGRYEKKLGLKPADREHKTYLELAALSPKSRRGKIPGPLVQDF